MQSNRIMYWECFLNCKIANNYGLFTVPGTVQNTLYMLSRLILTTILRDKCYCYSLTGIETEAPRG